MGLSLQPPVVPHAGTWIEILIFYGLGHAGLSFPTRERGLKYVMDVLYGSHADWVVPHAGTWIEMSVVEHKS